MKNYDDYILVKDLKKSKKASLDDFRLLDKVFNMKKFIKNHRCKSFVKSFTNTSLFS